MSKQTINLEKMLCEADFGPEDGRGQVIRHKIEQMRAADFAKPIRTKWHFSPRRLSFAATVLVLAVSLTIAGVVAARLLGRADPGGSYEIVVDREQIKSPENDSDYWDGGTGNLIVGAAGGRVLSKEVVEFAEEGLKGKLFDAYGNPVEIHFELARDGVNYSWPEESLDGEFYDEKGWRIYGIRWNVAKQELQFKSEAPDNKPTVVYTYDEAAAMLGADFAVPDIAGYSEKTYQFSDMIDRDFQIQRFHVTFTNGSGQMIHYFVEQARSEGEQPKQWMLSGTIEEHKISGQIVYYQNNPNSKDFWGRYVWQKDGIVYCLFCDDDFNLTDEEYVAIVESMIR